MAVPCCFFRIFVSLSTVWLGFAVGMGEGASSDHGSGSGVYPQWCFFGAGIIVNFWWCLTGSTWLR